MFKSILTLTTLALFNAQALALDCRGTEPFWAATLTNSALTLEFPGEKVAPLPITSTKGASGMSEDFLKVYKDERGPVAVLQSQECSDGMSDHIFPQEVILFTGSQTLYGCCGQPTNIPDSH